jgi:hypothetical protein
LFGIFNKSLENNIKLFMGFILGLLYFTLKLTGVLVFVSLAIVASIFANFLIQRRKRVAELLEEKERIGAEKRRADEIQQSEISHEALLKRREEFKKFQDSLLVGGLLNGEATPVGDEKEQTIEPTVFELKSEEPSRDVSEETKEKAAVLLQRFYRSHLDTIRQRQVEQQEVELVTVPTIMNAPIEKEVFSEEFKLDGELSQERSDLLQADTFRALESPLVS